MYVFFYSFFYTVGGIFTLNFTKRPFKSGQCNTNLLLNAFGRMAKQKVKMAFKKQTGKNVYFNWDVCYWIIEKLFSQLRNKSLGPQ